MDRTKKAQIIDEIQEDISKCGIGILTDYRGLKTAEINELRRKLRNAGIEYKVVKNTLAQYALEKTGKSNLRELFSGPVAVVFGYGDEVQPARILAEYIRTSKSTLSIKGGFLATRLLTVSDIEALSTLPSREILLAKVIGGMQSPLTGLVNVLVGPMRGMMGILQARIKQLEGA